MEKSIEMGHKIDAKNGQLAFKRVQNYEKKVQNVFEMAHCLRKERLLSCHECQRSQRVQVIALVEEKQPLLSIFDAKLSIEVPIHVLFVPQSFGVFQIAIFPEDLLIFRIKILPNCVLLPIKVYIFNKVPRLARE